MGLLAKAVPTSQERPPKNYAFLGNSPKGTEYIIHKKWNDMLPANNEEDASTKVKFQVGFIMNTVLHSMPKYNDSDFIFVQRKLEGRISDTEVWTGRDFKANEIRFAADATELRQRSFTYTRQQLIQNGHELTVGKKHLTIDGRLRAATSEVRAHADYADSKRFAFGSL